MAREAQQQPHQVGLRLVAHGRAPPEARVARGVGERLGRRRQRQRQRHDLDDRVLDQREPQRQRVAHEVVLVGEARAQLVAVAQRERDVLELRDRLGHERELHG